MAEVFGVGRLELQCSPISSGGEGTFPLQEYLIQYHGMPQPSGTCIVAKESVSANSFTNSAMPLDVVKCIWARKLKMCSKAVVPSHCILPWPSDYST